MTTIFDPLEAVLQQETKTSSELESNSRAMNNSDPSVCPKCGKGMVSQGLDAKEQVNFCTTCRVSSPQLIG